MGHGQESAKAEKLTTAGGRAEYRLIKLPLYRSYHVYFLGKL